MAENEPFDEVGWELHKTLDSIIPGLCIDYHLLTISYEEECPEQIIKSADKIDVLKFLISVLLENLGDKLRNRASYVNDRLEKQRSPTELRKTVKTNFDASE